MFKSILVLVTAMTISVTTNASAKSDEVALDITVYGKQMSPDAAFNKSVVEAIESTLFGSATVEGATYRWTNRDVKSYNLLGVGDEGGEWVCIEFTSADALAKAYETFNRLSASVPDDTSYGLKKLSA